MMRWKLILEYEGSAFCGWQRQENALSVQQVLEEAIEKFSGERVVLTTAGRTDAGVHALGQVAHFDLAKETSGEIVRDAINAHVRPHRVSVLSADAAAPNFNARLDARMRTYRYIVINRRAPLTVLSGQAWHIVKPLALHPMQEAAALLIGNHDFSTFRAANCQAKSPVKTLDAIMIEQHEDVFVFTVRARSFLYHQVRNIVGTLSMVGLGQWSVEDFKTAFEACDRTKGGPTAPADGLFFVGVEYPQKL